MNKSAQIAILFALFLCATNCQMMMQGMTWWHPRSWHNEASCDISVKGEIMPDGSGVWISQHYNNTANSASSQPSTNCSFYGFDFSSFFWHEQPNHSLQWMNTSDGWMNATMNATDLMMMNGTACLWLPQSDWAGIDQYMCRMYYGTIRVYLLVWGSWMNGNWMWDTTHTTTAWWPWAAETNKTTVDGTNWLTGGEAKPMEWMVSLSHSCAAGMNNNNISSLSMNVTVSTSLDLTAWHSGWWLAYTIVKPWNDNTMNGSYMVHASKSKWHIFDNAWTNTCWQMGMTYADMLPDMNYCANGCEVSFILMDDQNRIATMQTSGLWTNAADSSSTGTMTGNGNTWTGTIGSNGNGGSITVSSGLTLGMSVLFAVLSFVYINWL